MRRELLHFTYSHRRTREVRVVAPNSLAEAHGLDVAAPVVALDAKLEGRVCRRRRQRRRQPRQRGGDRGVAEGAQPLCSTAQPLYTRFPIVFGRCFFLKWQSDITLGVAEGAQPPRRLSSSRSAA